MIVCSLSDIRVLLASPFTREYIFEHFRQDCNQKQQIQAHASPVDLVKNFLQSAMEILTCCSSLTGVSYKQSSYTSICKLA